MYQKKKLNLFGFIICSIAALFYTYEYVLGILPSLLVREYMHIYNASATQVGFLTSFYYYPFFIMLLFVGPLIDYLKVRYIVFLNCGLCALTIYTMSIAQTLVGADISRFFMGVGSSFAYVSMLYLIEQWLSKKWFTLYISLYSAFGDLMLVIFNILLATILLTHSAATLEKGLAWIGFILAIVCLLALRNKNNNNNNSTIVDFNIKEFLNDSKSLLKSKQFLIILSLSLFFSAAWSVFGASWGLEFLRVTYHLTKSNAAIINSCLFGGCALGTVLLGLTADLFKKHKTQLIICASLYLILQLIVIYLSQITFIYLATAYFLMGVASGCTINLYNLAKTIAPSHLSATAMALVNMSSLVTYLILPPLVGRILSSYQTSTLVNGAQIFTPHAFKTAFIIVPACSLITLLLVLAIKPLSNNKHAL